MTIINDKVTHVSAIDASKRVGKPPAWQISVENAEYNIYSLKGASVGQTISYEVKQNGGSVYYLHVEQEGDAWVAAKTEELKKENKTTGYGGGGRRKQPPLSPSDAVSIYAQVTLEAGRSGLISVLAKELGFLPDNISSVITSLFIACTRERDDYEAPLCPPAVEVVNEMLSQPSNPLINADNEGKTSSDLLDDL